MVKLIIYKRGSIMNLIKDLIKKCAKNKKEERTFYVIIERLKPWIVLNCLERENYIITDKQAENIAVTILNQAAGMNVLNKVLERTRLV